MGGAAGLRALRLARGGRWFAVDDGVSGSFFESSLRNTQQPGKANLLIQVRPVDRRAAIDDLPVRPLFRGSALEERILRDWNADLATIGQGHGQLLVGGLNVRGECGTRQ